MLTVSTVNVNGLRAAAKKGCLEWLGATSADIVALQEVRADGEQLPDHLRSPTGWHCAFASASDKGRAGVALLSRAEPSAVRAGFGDAEFDGSGRYGECEFDSVVVSSLHLPSGDVGTERQVAEERFMAAFLPYLLELGTRRRRRGGRRSSWATGTSRMPRSI